MKLVLSREEEFSSTTTKHAAQIHMRSAVMNDGTIIGRDVVVYFNGGAYADISPRLIKNGGYSTVGPYRIPNVRIDSYALYTNQVPPAPTAATACRRPPGHMKARWTRLPRPSTWIRSRCGTRTCSARATSSQPARS